MILTDKMSYSLAKRKNSQQLLKCVDFVNPKNYRKLKSVQVGGF